MLVLASLGMMGKLLIKGMYDSRKSSCVVGREGSRVATIYWRREKRYPGAAMRQAQCSEGRKEMSIID